MNLSFARIFTANKIKIAAIFNSSIYNTKIPGINIKIKKKRKYDSDMIRTYNGI